MDEEAAEAFWEELDGPIYEHEVAAKAEEDARLERMREAAASTEAGLISEADFPAELVEYMRARALEAQGVADDDPGEPAG